MIILLHTSKTMCSPTAPAGRPLKPALLDRAEALAAYVRTLTSDDLGRVMHISPALAAKTRAQFADWHAIPNQQSLAIDSFVGDIYSGLRASSLSEADRTYAGEHLRILSGLYGILRPYDGIRPYRLEMGYRLPHDPYRDLYGFWGDAIAKCLPDIGPIINLASVEYSRTVLPFVDPGRVIAPKFLTIDQRTGQPAFVVVHAKIARGAFARWLITSRAAANDLQHFSDLGYRFDAALSTDRKPAFVCSVFGGKGLSMRRS